MEEKTYWNVAHLDANTGKLVTIEYCTLAEAIMLAHRLSIGGRYAVMYPAIKSFNIWWKDGEILQEEK